MMFYMVLHPKTKRVKEMVYMKNKQTALMCSRWNLATHRGIGGKPPQDTESYFE